ncbi:MAG: L,D-transpeptidase family protein [Bacteroidota bacterium]
MRFCFFILPLLLACESAPQSTQPTHEESATPIVENSTPEQPIQQLLVVVTDDWDNPYGTLRRYEGTPENWQQVGEGIPIHVGQKGMGWAKRASEKEDFTGPVKVEGDKKSPAGQFELGPSFGYAPQAMATQKWPYVPVHNATMCIEDANSQSYNQIIDANATPKDYNSTDRMRRKDDLYEWGVWVYHNFPDPEPSAGSCIFLHVWREGGKGTAGCTAMSKPDMQEVIQWLSPEKQPLLVQMPISAYMAVQRKKGLPAW